MSLPIPAAGAASADVTVRFCGRCGTPHRLSDRFCGGCGGPLPTAGTGPAGHADPQVGQVQQPAEAPLAEAVNAVVQELQQLPIKTLVPLRAWWDEGVWRRGATALFLAAAIAPFLLLHLATDGGDFHNISWGFSLYFACLWFIAMYTLVRPPALDWPLLAKVALFTIVAGVSIAIWLEKPLVGSGDLNIASAIFGVGLPEELAKALAVFLFLYRGRGEHSLRTYLFVGAVSGLAFGASEAVSYSQAYAQALPYVNDTAGVVTEIWRLVTDSLFHACLAGITAFFIGLARHLPGLRVALMSFGLAFAAVLHGLYDDAASGWLGAALAVLIVFVFIGYVHSGERIGEHLGTGDATDADADAPPSVA